MNHHFVIGINNQILFRNNICNGAFVGNDIPLHHMMSKFGLIIPVGNRALFTFMINGMMFDQAPRNGDLIVVCDDKTFDTDAKSIIIDQYSSIYTSLACRKVPFELVLNSIHYGYGLKFFICDNEDDIGDLSRIALDDAETVDDVFTSINKIIPVGNKHSYRIYYIDELTKWVAECFNNKVLIPFSGTVIIPSVIKELM